MNNCDARTLKSDLKQINNKQIRPKCNINPPVKLDL